LRERDYVCRLLTSNFFGRGFNSHRLHHYIRHPILAEVKPEAAYFAEDNGKRTGFIFLDVKDTSQIPALAELRFLAFNAHVEFHPAMNLDDLKKATPGIERAIKNYSRTAHAKAA